MREIVKIANLTNRIPEQGRIRFGEKGSKGEPRALKTFRLTSMDKEAISAIAAVYGGNPQPWIGSPNGEWEVITKTAEIRIVLPPDPLGGTPIYELWGGGGVQRRCDGETCVVPKQTAGGAELAEVPCICLANNAMACKPKLRLSVILPEIRFGGTWRLETSSWNAVHEIPGMVDLIHGLQAKGLTKALLALKPTKSVINGQTRRFVVPTLRLDESIEALVAGEARLDALGSGAAHEDLPALGYAEPESTPQTEEIIDVVDAEIVEDEPLSLHDDKHAKAQRRLFALLKEANLDPADRLAFAHTVSHGRTRRTSELSEDEYAKVLNVLDLYTKHKIGLEIQGNAVVITEVAT